MVKIYNQPYITSRDLAIRKYEALADPSSYGCYRYALMLKL